MNYDDIFEAYYALYRTEATTPNSSDDEYIIGKHLANEAINRWANYDNTYWRELFTTLGEATTGDSELAADTLDYACPVDMREVGGYVRIYNADNVLVRKLAIIEPHNRQFKSQGSQFAYFTGDPNSGFTMHLNTAPDTSSVGLTFDYDYYRKPRKVSGGNTKMDMSQPYFVVHRMLANRFRGSRNPYYGTAKTDAEDVLKTMQLENNSGTWVNPWRLADNSGTSWGE